MSVLLLQLAGPMQSWGDSSRFVRRETRAEPTKSAVIGLLASAQGRTREDPIEDLLGLRFGVRVEQRGRIMQDFQTEKSLSRKRNSREFDKVMPLTYRYYLADARFLVALEAEKTVLENLDHALRSPRWPLYLGRRSCPPEFPVTLGVHDEYDDVRQALEREPWRASKWYKRRYPDQQLEIVCDAADGESFMTQPDMPVTFSQKDRRYAGRAVHRYRIDNLGDVGSDAMHRQPSAVDEPPTFDSTGDADPMNFA
ncbi:type I-E CRISPR-associated protein Cas5/CasD [Bifidobacterium leontopitheci]|uniref:Type I-E CRISPR-associated protein Cas5/CasD n=1 Tax=Bifidobacterium leontopitheci TaxID=2650774 RepID=A0A6I1GKS2_9BIFI|nr:type I-E CRISPR-associated protein Cas5/CasD [Bifidobacterium leontopitheci]KAB7789967.1 type I-E CRISPR-associated protein Cas5/CasD [Bifidobacterium leontopitheci]